MPLSTESKSNLIRFAMEQEIKSHIGFNNFTQSVSLPDTIVFDVENREQLQQMIRQINAINRVKSSGEKIELRIAAGGYEKTYSESFSMTPCAVGDVIVRLVGEEFQKIELINKEKNMVRVGASVQIGELDRTLYDKHQLSMSTSSLIPYVTLAGLTANAGHGTGRDQPAVSGLIRAITFCRPDGVIERIDAKHPDFSTIRGSHLGLFGTVLNIEIECVKAKKLQCVMEARSINELIQEIKNGLFYQYPYVSIMYVPTYQLHERDAKNVIVFRWEPVALDVENSNLTPELTELEQSFSIKMNNLFNVPGFLARHSEIIPPYMKHLVARLEVGSTDKISVGPWPDVAHYQTAYPWSLDDADYLFNTRGRSCDEIVRAVEHVCDTLESYSRRGEYPVIDAIYLRFFKGTNGGLSTSNTQYEDEHICGFDIVSNAKIPGYAAFKTELEHFFSEQLQARPHWGKTVPLDKNYAKLYGDQYIIFMLALNEWYKKCGSTLEDSPYLNTFFRNILQVPIMQKTDQTEEIELPTYSSKQADEAIKQILSYIEECKLDNIHIRELKEKLKTCINERHDLHKKDNRFLSFFGSHTAHKPVTNEEHLKTEKEDGTCCVII